MFSGNNLGFSSFFLRLAISVPYLWFVSDRLGLLGSPGQPHVGWGDWRHFMDYAKQTMSFLPERIIPFFAVLASLGEFVFGFLLLIGFRTRWAAIGSGILSFLFGLSMAISFGIESPLGYSVFAVSAGSFLLAEIPGYRWSIDSNLLKKQYKSGNHKKINDMNKNIANYVVDTKEKNWNPLLEKGVDTTGISVKVLRFDQQANRAPSILLKFEPGAKYPYHNHPGGEEIFVLEGEAIIDGLSLSEGHYLYTPPGFKHSVTSKTGCTLLLVIPTEVEIM